MSDDEDNVVVPRAHKDMLQAIGMLGKTQHIRKVTRNETKKQQDEFQLTKGMAAAKVAAPLARVDVYDIVKVLKKTTKHLDAGKQLKNVQSTKKKLSKPLEKPVADRIKRSLGYEKTKASLGRWDAIVAKNRSMEQQVFPLAKESVFINTTGYKPLQMSLKTDAMLEMAAVEAKLKEFQKLSKGEELVDEKAAQEQEERLLQRKMTRKELQARRQEMSYLRMRESQKSAKARQRNKIKSKKYHKLLKKQKINEQMKQFELLQKLDPEAALNKLNEFERNRVMERASLRHKNTGTWAKNLQVRAKYDKDVRRDLAEQLQVSRELTQKKEQQNAADSDAEEASEAALAKEQEQEPAYDPFNPWMRAAAAKAAEEGSGGDEEANWRKYWLERNKNESALHEYRQEIAAELAKKAAKAKASEAEMPESVVSEPAKPTKGKAAKRKQKAPAVTIENDWLVEEIEVGEVGEAAAAPLKSRNIDDIFDDHEDTLREKLNTRLDNMARKKALNEAARSKRAKAAANKALQKNNKKAEVDELKTLKDLEFKNAHKVPEIDEELGADEDDDGDTAMSEAKKAQLASAKGAPTQNRPAKAASSSTDEAVIDPTKLADVILRPGKHDVRLNYAGLGDVGFDEAEEMQEAEDDHQMTLMEAFEDDDIVADFHRDKQKDSELKGAEVTLSMPGWGSWAGAGISQEKQTRKNQLVLNLAQKAKEEALAARKDSGMDTVYINEDVGKHLRAHLVSDLPFPFTSTQEYEASIRAPVGREFVPQTAFRILNRPSVITRKGQIIEAMDETELVRPSQRCRNAVDRRIAREMKTMKRGK